MGVFAIVVLLLTAIALILILREYVLTPSGEGENQTIDPESKVSEVRPEPRTAFDNPAQVPAPRRRPAPTPPPSRTAGSEETAPARSRTASPDPQLRLAYDLIDEGRIEDAVATLQNILQTQPNHEGALEELGLTYLHTLQDPEKALPYLRKALEANPENEAALETSVGVLLAQGKADEAEALLSGLQQQSPDSPNVLRGLGHIAAERGNTAQAIEYYQRASETAGESSRFALSNLAALQMREGQYEEAAQNYERLIDEQRQQLEGGTGESSPGQPDVDALFFMRLDQAKALIAAGRIPEAEAILSDLQKERPQDPYLAQLYSTLPR